MQTPARPFTIGGRTLSQAACTPPQPSSAGQPSSSRSVTFQNPTSEGAREKPASSSVGPLRQFQPTTSTSNVVSAPSPLSALTLQSQTPSTANSFGSVSSYAGETPASSSWPVQSLANTPATTLSRKPAGPAPATAPPPVNKEMVLKARKAAAAKSMRTNLVLLLAWYLITDSRLYSFFAMQVISAYPQSRMLFYWLVDRLLPILLLFGASKSFLQIKWAPESLPSSSAPSLAPILALGSTKASSASSEPTATRPASAMASVYKSSPKTRASPFATSSPSLSSRTHFAYSGSNGSPRPPSQHQQSGTPPRAFKPQYGSTESPTASLHRALVASAGTPPRSPPKPQNAPFGSSVMSPHNATPIKDTASPRVQAYWARHEPMGSSLHRSISAREDIDRLLAGEA